MRLAATAGLLAVAIAIAAAAGGGSDPAAAGAIALNLEVRDASGRAARRFDAGDPVDLVLEVRNPGAAPIALEFATARTHDFAILDAEDREVWRWSRGRLFAQALAQIELAPGETRRFTASWDQREAAGERAPPGRYRAVASLACMPAPPPAGPVELELD